LAFRGFIKKNIPFNSILIFDELNSSNSDFSFQSNPESLSRVRLYGAPMFSSPYSVEWLGGAAEMMQ